MTLDDIDSRVRRVITDVTHRDLSTVASDDDLVSVLGVDSLQSLQVLALVEQRLDVRLRDEELIDLRTIAKISEAVARNPSTRSLRAGEER